MALLLLLAFPLAATVSGSRDLREYPRADSISVEASIPTPSGSVTTAPLSDFNAAREYCPATCDAVGLDSLQWDAYHDVGRLTTCNRTMLLDFALYNPLDNADTHVTIRCCSAGVSAPAVAGTNASEASRTRINKRDDSDLTRGNLTEVKVPFQIAFNESDVSASVNDFVDASQQISDYLSHQRSNDEQVISFAYSRSAAVGMFAGSGVQSQGVAESVLSDFISSIQSSGYSESALVQLCSNHNRSSRYSMGIITNAKADVGFVQEAVATWASGDCVTKYDKEETWKTFTLSMPTLLNSTHLPLTNGTLTNGTSILGSEAATHVARALAPRATCSTEQVKSGDTCSSLASECGITPAEFTKYNSEPNECSTLTAGEHVCCSAGTLPDYSPKPYANGTCSTYLVQTGDYCSELAASYSITVDQLESFNNNTWGWMGCSDLQAGYTICLSTGSPPMPAPVKNAVCGPQVPDTPVAPAGTDYSKLNECPLNACCDIWGQCGTTSDFCTASKSPTGAPGTAAQGTNGCISNCGTDIVTGSAPSGDFKVAYFEGFNLQRPCLNQPVENMDFSGYTHVHMSFAGITSGFAMDVSSIQKQFDSFVTMSGFKKILSIGGWAFCTDPGTYALFREAVAPGNRDTFAANIASFINEYQLDGIDIDWEYPGEPDIPGIPAGTKADGTNYVAFLQSLKSKMPSGTTVSFTAPASFWYLKAFPIKDMAPSADYIVYMTYDLHGQWDYGNRFTDPGCPGGNCLRSDVNLTETITALSMVTKAGVPANKIVVGVTSYGRSFQMTTAGCYTDECTYTGPNSGAYAGECTQTPGYISNAEINAIIAGNATVYNGNGSPVGITGTPYTYIDQNSNSNIVVYDDTQWIGYMDDSIKASRTSLYRSYNFLGTADWAVDLQSFDGSGPGNSGNSGSGGSGGSIVSISPSIWNSGDPTIQCEPPCIFVLPPYPLGATTTVTWPALTTTLLSSSGNAIKTITTTISVPEFTLTDFSLQPVTLQPTETATYKINPVQSVTPTSFMITLGPNEATFPPTPIPTSGQSVGGPGASGGNPHPGTTSSSTGAVIPVGVTFHTTPFPVTIQPQPTYSVILPPVPKPIPVVTITPDPPKPDCSGAGCGDRDCGIFGCTSGCGLFACNGGCGIFGCGGGCGPFGCVGACPLDQCGGLDCVTPGSCGGAEGGGDGQDDPDKECEEPVTVSACTYLVSSFTTGPSSTFTTTTKTECETTTTCDGADTKTTETAGACSISLESDYASERTAAGTMVSGSLIPTALYPTDVPGAPSPTGSQLGMSLSSTTTNCEACTYVNGNEALCTYVAGCTRVTTITSTTTVHPTTTVTETIAPSVTAKCAYWYLFFGYTFEIYDIQGVDFGSNGDKLHKQEDGCGALTFWEWGTDSGGSYAEFDLPLFIKDGCVERALVSAGGPKLSCSLQPKKRKRSDRSLEIDRRAAARRAASSSSSSLSMQSDGPSLFDTGTPTYSYSTSATTSTPTYVPMTWSETGTGAVTFTWTYDSYSTSVITTTTVIASASTAPLPVSTTPSSTQPSRTSTSTSTSASVMPPGPTQSGIMSSCNKYYVVQSGDSCSSVESMFDITFAQLYAWNPAIGSNCANLWVGEAYCVGVSGSSSTTTSTSSTTSGGPSAPTQSGITSSCTEYYEVKSGDSCSSIESDYGITFSQFYDWNPAVGSNCQSLWVGYDYCVAT